MDLDKVKKEIFDKLYQKYQTYTWLLEFDAIEEDEDCNVYNSYVSDGLIQLELMCYFSGTIILSVHYNHITFTYEHWNNDDSGQYKQQLNEMATWVQQHNMDSGNYYKTTLQYEEIINKLLQII